MSAKELIKDKDFQQPLSDFGFCVCPLFSKEQIYSLRDLYRKLSAGGNIFGSTSNEVISNEILEIIAPALENAFSDFEFFVALFIEKEAKRETEYRLQQD